MGLANGHNPIAIVVPCHRVIGAGGSLTGYGGGLERKRTLLELEKRRASVESDIIRLTSTDPQKECKNTPVPGVFLCMFGGVLLFHPNWAVSSALTGLASGFGMGPGVSLSLWPP